MSQPEHYDVLILGSGAGGKLLAWHMARSGRRTAVVERQWIGGSCPNIACLPSKNEILERRGRASGAPRRAFGTIDGPRQVDMAKVRQRKRDMVEARGRHASAELQGERRRVDHGERALCRAENARGAA